MARVAIARMEARRAKARRRRRTRGSDRPVERPFRRGGCRTTSGEFCTRKCAFTWRGSAESSRIWNCLTVLPTVPPVPTGHPMAAVTMMAMTMIMTQQFQRRAAGKKPRALHPKATTSELRTGTCDGSSTMSQPRSKCIPPTSWTRCSKPMMMTIKLSWRRRRMRHPPIRPLQSTRTRPTQATQPLTTRLEAIHPHPTGQQPQ
mmetsp:Transcript_1164/g.2599  ORF Transcript_1164/g.2599 Transcript_1164/m.2599 type:complete len:203 (-) Transcript_1164:2282-2890(-)